MRPSSTEDVVAVPAALPAALERPATTVTVWPVLLHAALPALFFYLAAVYGLHWFGIPILDLIQDPGQVTGQPRHVGLISNIGAFIWFGTAAVALFASYCVRDRPDLAAGRHLLLVGGLMSLLLGGDDFFMLHDGPVPEKLLFVAYALAALYILSRSIEVLRSLEPRSLFVACAFLGLSVGIDVTQRYYHFPFAYEQLVEDGLKFVGIAAWAYFWLHAGAALVSRAATESTD